MEVCLPRVAEVLFSWSSGGIVYLEYRRYCLPRVAKVVFTLSSGDSVYLE